MVKYFLNNIYFLKLNNYNLINVLVKEIINNNLLMSAWVNYFIIIKIFYYKKIFFFSRRKKFFWIKGFFSKNFQYLKYIFIDCDLDCLFLSIFQKNKTSCHTFKKSCFFNKILLK